MSLNQPVAAADLPEALAFTHALLAGALGDGWEARLHHAGDSYRLQFHRRGVVGPPVHVTFVQYEWRTYVVVASMSPEYQHPDLWAILRRMRAPLAAQVHWPSYL